ncbi:MAG: PLP-dependent aspartate aminotransferase family protein, partial [Bacteroidia bacterium]|nr:PLP-dependent aspartate aminotransferase family protein [Bacteroidia bacterium]
MSATKIIHSVPSDPLTGSISVPVYQTSTFIQEAPGVNKGYDYARTNNPTRKVLEDVVAQLEEGHSGFAFATGLAAIDAVLKLLSAGDEIIAVDDIYGGAYRLFTHVYEKLGIDVNYVDTTDVSNVANAVSKRTKIIWIESPTNPTLKVSDIQKIAIIAHSVGALLVVDNTFASPIAQQPIKLGADIVIHSGTKYIGGHSDLVAGLVVTKTAELAEKLKFIQNASGGVLGPWDCFLTIRGIETLELRFKKQSENAFAVAAFLKQHPAIEEVFYPGLSSHKNHDVAKRQQNELYGGIV